MSYGHEDMKVRNLYWIFGIYYLRQVFCFVLWPYDLGDRWADCVAWGVVGSKVFVEIWKTIGSQKESTGPEISNVKVIMAPKSRKITKIDLILDLGETRGTWLKYLSRRGNKQETYSTCCHAYSNQRNQRYLFVNMVSIFELWRINQSHD